jgi:hypothetical protein
MAGWFERHDLALASIFVAVGLGAWLHWSITDPSFDVTEAQSEWDHVLGFSALVLALMGAAAALGQRLSSAASVRRLDLTLIATGALSAVTNIVEDGFGVEGAFFVFILLTGIQLVALIGLAIALGISVRGRRRLLALTPLASATGVVVYVHAGGPILLCTWCAAAAYLLATRGHAGSAPAQ